MFTLLPNHCPKIIMGSFSYKIKPKWDHQRKDGTYAVFMQCYINKKQLRINIGIYCTKENWDEKNQRFKIKSNLSDYNLIIESARTRAMDIVTRYRISEQLLTVDAFRYEYENPTARICFIKFMHKESEKNKGILTKGTLQKDNATIKKLIEFVNILPFYDLTPEFLRNFENWLLNTKQNNLNTTMSTMKRIKKYVKIAIEEKAIRIKNPFLHYKIRQVQGNRTCLTLEELNRLKDLYEFTGLNKRIKKVLQPFLFSCHNGGIRISDIKGVTREMIEKETISMLAYKTRKHNKLIDLPLLPESRKYINESGPVFDLISPQKINKYLKEAAAICGISKHLTFHVARHTFASLFCELGGSTEVLQKILGHSDIKETMIYVHIADKRKAEQMFSFSDKLAKNKNQLSVVR